MFDQMILSTAYLPPISYFKKIIASKSVVLEKHEHFVKQTYRNRCVIYGANGVQILSIPLVNTHEKTVIAEKHIAYKQNWQQQHWRSIESAYRNSPYFIYYADELKPFYEDRYELLFEYNTALLKVILKLLRINCEIQFTNEYEKDPVDDHRSMDPGPISSVKNFKEYTQVFSDKHGFKPDLSIIDLVFNLGPDSVSYLNS